MTESTPIVGLIFDPHTLHIRSQKTSWKTLVYNPDTPSGWWDSDWVFADTCSLRHMCRNRHVYYYSDNCVDKGYDYKTATLHHHSNMNEWLTQCIVQSTTQVSKRPIELFKDYNRSTISYTIGFKSSFKWLLKGCRCESAITIRSSAGDIQKWVLAAPPQPYSPTCPFDPQSWSCTWNPYPNPNQP